MKNNDCAHKQFLNLYSIKGHILLNSVSYETSKTREVAMADMRCFIDNICDTFNRQDLSSRLNDFQCALLVILGEPKMRECSLGDKDKIPLYFINLFLKDINMVLEDE